MISLGLRNEAASGQLTPEPAAHAELAARLQQVINPRLQVLRPVAVGGMATLFELCHRQHHGRLLAKVLHPDLLQRPGVAAGFRNEAVHLALLGDHPNLLPILDAELEGHPLYLVFPFIEGEDLDRVLQRGSLPEAEALHLTAQVSSVLAHMESHGIVHADISPGNLRLDTFGRIRLLDFGLSRRTQSDAGSLPAIARGGTPLYQSPEQIEGKLPTHRSDLYALGLVLAEMLTGAPLMQADTLEAIQQKHLAAQRPLSASLPDHTASGRLVRRLIARDPAERIGSAFELSGALAALGYERPEFRPHPLTHRRRRLAEA